MQRYVYFHDKINAHQTSRGFDYRLMRSGVRVCSAAVQTDLAVQTIFSVPNSFTTEGCDNSEGIVVSTGNVSTDTVLRHLPFPGFFFQMQVLVAGVGVSQV